MSGAVPDIQGALAGGGRGHRHDAGRAHSTAAPVAPPAVATRGGQDGYAAQARSAGRGEYVESKGEHIGADYRLPAPSSSAAPAGAGGGRFAGTSIEAEVAAASALSAPPSADSFDAKVADILRRLTRGRDAAERRGALHEVGHLSYEGSQALKPPYFGQFLGAVIDVLSPDVPYALQEAALAVIRRMLRHQGALFEDFTEVLMAKLLTCSASEAREVVHAADRTMDLLVGVVDPRRALQVLIPIINGHDVAALQSGVCTLSRLVSRLPLAALQASLPAFMPGLLRGFKSTSADVRKAVVFCLVDLYMAAGDSLTPHLASLNVAQLKLVTIYVNRTLKAKADKEGREADAPPASLGVLTAAATAKSLNGVGV